MLAYARLPALIYVIYIELSPSSSYMSHRTTVHVEKAESFSFAYGGCADVWKGKWKDGIGGQMVSITYSWRYLIP